MTKTRLSARVDDRLLEESKKYYSGSINSLLEFALEEFIQKRRPDVEQLHARKKELEEELNKVISELENANATIEKHEQTKKDKENEEKEETPLESVKKAISRQLENCSIDTIIKSVYMKAFQKKLGWSEQQIIDLIISMAPDAKRQEYDTMMTPLDPVRRGK